MVGEHTGDKPKSPTPERFIGFLGGKQKEVGAEAIGIDRYKACVILRTGGHVSLGFLYRSFTS